MKKVSYSDNEKFRIEVRRGNVVKAAQMRKGKNQGFADIEDYYINLGYFDRISGDIHVKLTKYGVYDYDAIRVYAVPMDIYDESAAELEANRYDVESWSNEEFTGTMSAEGQGGIMYFSILDNPGWDIYVDGEKTEKLDAVNLSFTGAVLESGEHRVELRYRTPYLIPSIALSVAGVLITAALAWIYSRRKKEITDAGINKKTTE